MPPDPVLDLEREIQLQTIKENVDHDSVHVLVLPIWIPDRSFLSPNGYGRRMRSVGLGNEDPDCGDPLSNFIRGKKTMSPKIEIKLVRMEYGQVIYQCPTEEAGYMCDLEDACSGCPLISSNNKKKEIDSDD